MCVNGLFADNSSLIAECVWCRDSVKCVTDGIIIHAHAIS